METKFINCALNGLKAEIVGWKHSDKADGKYTKAQKKFIRIENNKVFYIGKKRFIRPIVTFNYSNTQPRSDN